MRAAALLVLLAAVDAAAATVSGTVTRADGSPAAGARVAFARESEPTNETATTCGEDGQYSMDLAVTTAVAAGGQAAPGRFELLQNYPNPFNPTTVIRFHLTEPGPVRLVVHNALGQPVRTLVDEGLQAGWQRPLRARSRTSTASRSSRTAGCSSRSRACASTAMPSSTSSSAAGSPCPSRS